MPPPLAPLQSKQHWDAIHRVRAIIVIVNTLCYSGADAMNRVPTILFVFRSPTVPIT